MQTVLDDAYWSNRYTIGTASWDLKAVSPPLKAYFDQLTNKNSSILIAGCGQAHEAAYLLSLGFKNITLVDVSEVLVSQLQQTFKNTNVKIYHKNIFEFTGQFDFIFEQTLFCAIEPKLRATYVNTMYNLLKPTGKLVGVLFGVHFEKAGPPFGGTLPDYQQIFSPKFNFKTFAPCYNSITPRQGTELFINCSKKL
jgi:methyl halide transferase